ncbi:MAG: precorrin-3B C(17)-methyltransferase [Desulfotignum sp.]
MSQRAKTVIEAADCIAGYTTYIDLIEELVADKKIISTGMMKEVDRVASAIQESLSGRSCALISGGDPGIYAMAGLVFELCKERNIPVFRPGSTASRTTSPTGHHPGFGPETETGLTLEIVPGIPALAAGAALAGAPLTHDFAAISLSDLLTKWETIEKRVTCAAMGDFVIVIYNPKSKKRTWQLARAQELILAHRDNATPVAVVTGAMRENQHIVFTRLDQLHTADIGMQTVLFVGSSSTVEYMDFIFTPRGYTKKYAVTSDSTATQLGLKEQEG